MLTQGNHKLGGRLIWSFSLPSARPDICVGMSDLCRRHCYARRLEKIRPAMLARYEANYRLGLSSTFARRVRAFLVAHDVAVVRLHVGDDFFSSDYARKWLRIMRRSPQVRFYFYTRSWRDEATRTILERMASLPNCRAWYSCDRETGVPSTIPPGVRLAWLSSDPTDVPPASASLVFRVRKLRSRQATHLNEVRICPAEDGIPRTQPVTCERCQSCWQPLPDVSARRVSLPLLPPLDSLTEEGR
jgi:Gene product 88